jgi:hypothetical protein
VPYSAPNVAPPAYPIEFPIAAESTILIHPTTIIPPPAYSQGRMVLMDGVWFNEADPVPPYPGLTPDLSLVPGVHEEMV